MEFYMHNNDNNSYMMNDIVQKTIHQTNFAKTIKWRHWYSTQTRICKTQLAKTYVSLRTKSKYTRNKEFWGPLIQVWA